jgi:hypothetical protein
VSEIFDPEQLDALATPMSIHVERAALSRKPEDLPWVIEQMDAETLGIYDAYVSWMGVLQTYILEKAGQAAHDLAVTWAGEYGARPFVRRYAGLGARDRALLLAERLRASGSTFEVVEDDERIRFELDPWGPIRWWRRPESEGRSWEKPQASGARLRYPTYGHYGGPAGFAGGILEGARPFTHGRDSLPAFLATEIQFLEAMPIELCGHPIAVIGLPERPEEAATLDLYKDPAAVPAEVYRRVGAEKPTGALPGAEAGTLLSPEERERMATPLSLRVAAAAAAADFDDLLAISAGMDRELVGAKDPLGIMIAACFRGSLGTWARRPRRSRSSAPPTSSWRRSSAPSATSPSPSRSPPGAWPGAPTAPPSGSRSARRRCCCGAGRWAPATGCSPAPISPRWRGSPRAASGTRPSAATTRRRPST